MTETTITKDNTNDEFLDVGQMMDYYPLLTVMFDVASDVLMKTAMEADTKQQFKLELNTLYKSIMSNAKGFSENYDDLSDDEQEAECKAVGSYLYFASLMRMFAKKVEQAPIIEESNTEAKDDGTSNAIH
ncbi:hypothetical protein A1D29_02045 [Pasteurellaceae bacterium Orientalotternb1]|nr:hypothetical protein A1D29_02045 [Pasteurellaceae bacterium Orientalotternb1]